MFCNNNSCLFTSFTSSFVHSYYPAIFFSLIYFDKKYFNYLHVSCLQKSVTQKHWFLHENMNLNRMFCCSQPSIIKTSHSNPLSAILFQQIYLVITGRCNNKLIEQSCFRDPRVPGLGVTFIICCFFFLLTLNFLKMWKPSFWNLLSHNFGF